MSSVSFALKSKGCWRPAVGGQIVRQRGGNRLHHPGYTSLNSPGLPTILARYLASQPLSFDPAGLSKCQAVKSNLDPAKVQ